MVTKTAVTLDSIAASIAVLQDQVLHLQAENGKTGKILGDMHNDMHKGFQRIDERFTEVDQQFTEVEKRFTQIEQRFTRIDQRFIQIDKQFAQIDKRFNRIDQQFTQIDEKFNQVDKRFTEVTLRFEGLERYIDFRDDGLEQRLFRVEEKVDRLLER